MEAPGKQNGSLVQARTQGGMNNHGWDARWQTGRVLGLAPSSMRPSPADIPRGRGTNGMGVWPSASSEHMKPKRKMEHNKYDPGAEIFERTQLLQVRWPAQVKTPPHRLPTPKPVSLSPFSLGAPNLGTGTVITKGPPPLSSHPAFPKNLNGRIPSDQSLVTEYSRQVNSLEKQIHVMWNSAPHPRENLVIQSAKNPRSFTGESYQSLLANRQISSVKKDVSSHRPFFTEHHSIYRSQLGSPAQHGIPRRRKPSDMVDIGSAEQCGYVSRTVGELQPINLCKKRGTVDPDLPEEESAMEVAAAETGKSTGQCSAKVETGGPSKYRTFLLIDSKGMPYTVLVEEPKPANRKAPGNAEGCVGTSSSSSGTAVSSARRKMYSCPICSRVFEYLSYLQRHSITHSEQKPYACDTCGKAFKRTSHLERHKYTHSVGKPYECRICQRCFRDTGELAHHHRVHTGERPYQCEICHMRFGERNTLQRHVQRKHPKQPFPPESVTESMND